MNIAENVTPPTTVFKDIIPSPELLAAVERLGHNSPTPVQAQAIPAAISGKDLVVQAKTGSGKTLAFVLPLLHHLEPIKDEKNTFGLIVTPTRELATQICEVIFGVSGIRPVCVIGGVSTNEQIRELDAEHRIIVGTPGRILDLMQQRVIMLRRCGYFVLDEADEMLSMGFLEKVREILSRIPEEAQGLFVSATISPRVKMLASDFLNEPETILVAAAADEVSTIEHCYYEVGGEVTAKATALCDLIETQQPASAIIFCNTKSDTELVDVFLRRRGFDARAINSDLTQKQRDYLMSRIRANELRFLVATDIAARGLDIEQIGLVVNYAVHEAPETYVHRTGRTGRAGRSGKAVSLVGPQDSTAFLNLKRTLKIEPTKLTPPTEEEVSAARVAHLVELLGFGLTDVQSRDMLLAKLLLKEHAAIEAPSDALQALVARLSRYAIERSLPKAISLEDEMRTNSQSRTPSAEDWDPQGGSSSGDRRDRGSRGGGGSHRDRRHDRGGSRGHRR